MASVNIIDTFICRLRYTFSATPHRYFMLTIVIVPLLLYLSWPLFYRSILCSSVQNIPNFFKVHLSPQMFITFLTHIYPQSFLNDPKSWPVNFGFYLCNIKILLFVSTGKKQNEMYQVYTDAKNLFYWMRCPLRIVHCESL